MTWRDFSIYVIAKERNDMQTAIMTREIVFAVYNTAGKSFKDLKRMDIWELATDEPKVKSEAPSAERIERLMKVLQNPQQAQA